jgi:molybdopterin molybdotransferase
MTPIRMPVHGTVQPVPSVTRLVPVSLIREHATVVPGARPASLRAVANADALAVIENGWITGGSADILPLP